MYLSYIFDGSLELEILNIAKFTSKDLTLPRIVS